MASEDWIQRLRDLTQNYVTGTQESIANINDIRAAKKEQQAKAQATALQDAETNMRSRISESQTRATQQYQAIMSDMQSKFAAIPRQQTQATPTGAVTTVPGNIPYTGSSKGSRAALKGMSPGQNLQTVKTKYGRVTINKKYAQQFTGFINELGGRYGITSLGGYANRNIAGTSTASLHSYGLAIDINPGANPVTHGKVRTNLPPNIAQLAAKYGLSWGGSWRGSKKDPMHFSIQGFGE